MLQILVTRVSSFLFVEFDTVLLVQKVNIENETVAIETVSRREIVKRI